MKIFCLIVGMLLAYLYGSIPFALVIGKVFYGIDVRNYGSGNLGGTNAGRVLGKKAGLACIILDVCKCLVSVLIAKLFIDYLPNPNCIYMIALACVLGHCYPIFASFKGGKAVSVIFGYLLATNFTCFIICLAVFLITLKITKYVSLSSMVQVVSLVIITPLIIKTSIAFFVNLFLALFLIYRHRENIVRLKNGTESKIKWM